MPSPQDAFDTWFRTLGFRGRDTLEDLPQSLQDQLRGFQTMYNEASERERTFPEYTRTLPLYLDFIDADVENAIATNDGEHYAYIGITKQLIFRIADLCVVLARFDGPVCRTLNVRSSPEDHNELQATLVYILLSFVVAHEWSHHKHGHLGQLSSPGKIFQEVLNTAPIGSVDDQIKEIAADGYAAFLLLAHLLDDRRDTFLPFLTFTPAPSQEAIEQLFLSLLIVTFAGFMLQLSTPPLNATDIYSLTHPPAPARLTFFVREVNAWCSHSRPAYEEWIVKNFMVLLNATTQAVHGLPDFRHVWGQQVQFLASDEGKEYDAVLMAGIANYRKHWGEETQPADSPEPPVALQLQLIPAINDPMFQTAVAEMLQGLQGANIVLPTRSIALSDMAGAGVAGVFALLASTLGPKAITELRKLLETYLAHGGRKIKLKNDAVSIECSPEDFQKIFTPEQIQKMIAPPPQKALPPKKKVKRETA